MLHHTVLTTVPERVGETGIVLKEKIT
jgi:hypothetical protein